MISTAIKYIGLFVFSTCVGFAVYFIVEGNALYAAVSSFAVCQWAWTVRS